MSRLGPNDGKKSNIEMEVIQALRKRDYNLNTINSCGENLLHTSAANGCAEITREILAREKLRQLIDRKNKFGWTPLMIAIRNRDVETVKCLLKNKANTNKSTYLGMSALGLAAAINLEMFEIVYNADPQALQHASTDDITPLCIAALKNDRELFLRLVDLGFQPSKANEYTQIMMRRSTVPEISNFSTQRPQYDDYWNDPVDNIEILPDPPKPEQSKPIDIPHCLKTQGNEEVTGNSPMNPLFKFDSEMDQSILHSRGIPMPLNLNLLLSETSGQQSLISPRLSCDVHEGFANSPNICFVEKDGETSEEPEVDGSGDESWVIIESERSNASVTGRTPVLLQRLQSIRPPDLNILNHEADLNTTLGFMPQFSPLRSPNVPPEINDENVFGDHTPSPPRHRTPPRGMMMNSEEMKMFILMKRFGLNHLTPIFLKEEVDFELFLTLTDADLLEIGIEKETDRVTLLEAIADCRRITSNFQTYHAQEYTKTSPSNQQLYKSP